MEKTSKELIDEFVKSTVMMLTALGSVTGRMADEQEVMNLHKERLSQLIEALMPSEEEILVIVAGNIPWAIKPQRKAKTQFINPFTSGHAFSEVIRILSENLSKELRTRILDAIKTNDK